MRTQKILVPYQGREKYKQKAEETTGGIIYASGINASTGGGGSNVSFSQTITPASPDSYKIGSITIDGTTTSIYGQNSTQTGVPEWYNIKWKYYTKGDTQHPNTIWTVIENFNNNLLDTTQYRLVLMKWGRHTNEGNAWKIPMLSPRWEDKDAPAGNTNIKYERTLSSIAWGDTWWPVKSALTEAFNTTGHSYKEVLFPKWTGDTFAEVGSPLKKRANTTVAIWKNTHNRKYRFGVCLMKRTGAGTYGWQRVSNIAPITLFIPQDPPATNTSKSIQVEPNKF